MYTALTPEGALAEYRKRVSLLGDASQDWRRRDLVSLRVVVENVLELTDTAICKSFGISHRRICDDTEESLEACRIVADAARERGYVAIRAPSAADDREENLMIYIDIRADLIQLDVGLDRIPILR